MQLLVNDKKQHTAYLQGEGRKQNKMSVTEKYKL